MAQHQIAIEQAKENLLACAAFLAGNIKNSDGHAEAMEEIIPRYLEKGEVDFAAELADTIDDPFTRDKLLMRVAEKCAAMDDDEYAFQLVEAIEDSSSQAHARGRIVFQKAIKGDFRRALEIAHELDHADNALIDIALHQAAAGDEENAEATIAKIDFPLARVTALQNLAELYLEKKNETKVIELLDKALAAAGEIEFPEGQIRALINCANLFFDAKRKDKAIETLDRAKTLAENLDSVLRDALMAEIALGFLQAGSLDLADRALDLVSDKTQIASCLVGFASEFHSADNVPEATETLEEAYAILKSQRDGEVRDSRARMAVFAAIAVEFANVGKSERALEVAQENAGEAERISALAQIAQVFTSQNRIELARQAVSAIEDDAQKISALTGVARVKKQSGETESANAFLNEAANLIETIPQFTLRSQTLNELIHLFYDYGNSAKARQLAQENLRTISQIRNSGSRAAALARLADFYERSELVLNESEREILETIMRRTD